MANLRGGKTAPHESQARENMPKRMGRGSAVGTWDDLIAAASPASVRAGGYLGEAGNIAWERNLEDLRAYLRNGDSIAGTIY